MARKIAIKCSSTRVFLLIFSGKKVLSRTFKGSSAQRSAGTFKGSRWNPLEMALGGTLPEEP